MNIIIIGSGWYGCHIASILKKYNIFNITIIEKNNTIFNNSSYYNQNRLHYGYHYPRNYNTRQLCKNNYDKFILKYNFCINYLHNNYYLISNNSIIDYETYIHIYKFENFYFNIINNNIFSNIQNDILSVNEHVINSDLIKSYFESNLNDIDIVFNTRVNNYIKNDNIISVICDDNKIFECDLLLDCTYNQLGLSTKKYYYELTISLLFKKTNNTLFDAITIMDGKFCSLYPRDIDNNIYTLTDVEYTPVFSSDIYEDIENYKPSNDEITNIKNNMINKLLTYYPSFLQDFEYLSYFLAKKTKLVSASDSRDINIEEIQKNVISVNCGKIYGIFEFEKYILNYLDSFIHIKNLSTRNSNI